jgi:hypothetical protein
MAMLRQTLVEVIPLDGRFHAPHAKRIPGTIDATSMTNMRQAELNGAGTTPSVHASENLHWKKTYERKKRNIAMLYVNMP